MLFKLRSTVVHIICKHPTSGSIIEAPCGWCRKILKNYKQLHAWLGIRLMHSISFENMHERGKHIIIKTMIWRLLQKNCKNGWICVACFLLPQNILAPAKLKLLCIRATPGFSRQSQVFDLQLCVIQTSVLVMDAFLPARAFLGSSPYFDKLKRRRSSIEG